MKNILITGVSSGIGHGCSKIFIENGYRVFGSVRNQQDADRLKKEFGVNYFPIIMDITDTGSINLAAKIVEKEVGESGLCGLINNAGATTASPLMHVPIEVFRRNLEVLVIGQLAVTQAFLPILGASKNCERKPGRIINVGSIYGKLYVPFMGNYVTAKHAMEGLSKTLRVELKLYGIDVITVGPGIIKTPIWEKNGEDTFAPYTHTDYFPLYQKMYPMYQEQIENEGFDLDVFCEKMVSIFESRRPKARYAVVKNKWKNWTILRMIPDKLMNKIYARKMGIKKKIARA